MSAALAAQLLALACAGLPTSVAVVPLGGSAPEADRARATEVVATTVAGLDGLRAISLVSAAGVLGAEGEAQLAACADDACRVEKTRVIRAGVLVAGSLDLEGQKTLIRLRLIDTSSAAGAVRVRVSREVPTTGAEVAFTAAVGEAVAELFPAEAARSSALLVISGAPAGAAVISDGKVVSDPLRTDVGAPIRLRGGVHAIRVVAPGHHAWKGEVELTVGQRRLIEVELVKNRSNAPYILGGLGVLAGGVALALGASADGAASDWADACAGASCAQGYTRARFEADEASIDRRRVSANGLFVVSAVALTAGVVWFLFDPGVDDLADGGAR